MDSQNIKLVQTTLEHVDDIIAFENDFEYNTLSPESLINDINSSNYYYVSAIYNENVIGYAGIHILVDHADIMIVAVDKNFQNKGIGKMLLSHLISKIASLNIESVFLEVRESNFKAIKLYESYEFKKINERKKYYKNKDNSFENAYVYERKI